MSHFGRTGANKRPRLRKFHAEILLRKFLNNEKVLNINELNRPIDYVKRIVKYSKGFLTFINEEVGEVEITELFFNKMITWYKQYTDVEELDHSDENLQEQGILLSEDGITFDGRLTYSRFYKIISDEGEGLNNPTDWDYNEENLELHSFIDFTNRASSVFESRLFLLKFYIMRKIDEVAFVTSRYVSCPVCGANYVIPSSKIDFQQTYKCEKLIGEKKCGTTLKKFPARKMIPTYIYEIGVEVVDVDGTVEFREFFLESYVPLNSGFYTGMCFGRTENKTNSFYFNCLTAKEDKGKYDFEYIKNPENKHEFFNITDSITKHIQKVGFVIDEEKARLPVYIETLKKLSYTFNKEINLAHSLYFGAPGIGKTYALTMLHHLFYSNSGFISGPRFTLAGLTGGQREVFYQDTAKKRSVTGLFSNQAFIFDEINNAQFLADDKATNLFKSVALSASGTSSTVGGKEFPRTSLISATANYDLDHLAHYENKIKKLYTSSLKSNAKPKEIAQSAFINKVLEEEQDQTAILNDFDFYKQLKDYNWDVPKELKRTIISIRDDAKNYLTNFPKPLMERFYYSVLVHPKYDKSFLKQKEIDVHSYLESRKSQYSQREMISQLFTPEFTKIILSKAKPTIEKFNNPIIEEKWGNQAKIFLKLMASRYNNFFSMFNRISQVHVFTLFALSMINGETELSFETRHIFEKIISLLHVPISIEDFHNPNFKDFKYIGETKGSLLDIIKILPLTDLRTVVDFENTKALAMLVALENDRKIKKVADYKYIINKEEKFEVIEK